MVQLACRRFSASRMRILIGQPGYDLLNPGDVAMLQSCVARLRQQWPGAEIMVTADDPQRLASCCPGTVAIGRGKRPRLALSPPRTAVRRSVPLTSSWPAGAPT